MRNYELKYLFEAVTVDGKVWRQTPDDSSQLDPYVGFYPPGETFPAMTLHPAGMPAELRAQIAAGDDPVFLGGAPYSWRRQSAFSDLQPYADCYAIREFTLRSQVSEQFYSLCLHASNPEFADVGDIVFAGGKIPCALGIEPRPKLKLDYRRRVTRLDTGVVAAVAYLLGWKYTHGKVSRSWALELY